MIQRIQSIFLLLASAGLLSLFLLPFAKSAEASGAGTIYENMTLDLQDHVGLLGLAVAGGLIALIAIFLFGNRSLQKTLAWLTVLLSIGLVALAGWLYSAHNSSTAGMISLGMGFAMPIISAILAILAGVYIGKDDNLVKSMDRLR